MTANFEVWSLNCQTGAMARMRQLTLDRAVDFWVKIEKHAVHQSRPFVFLLRNPSNGEFFVPKT